MNFSKQLKKYRELNKLSQEALAEKIYVTRQTISKWENDKTYPDIHNLVTLSLLFEISLDELVKGDVKVMRNEVSKAKWNFWTWNIIIFLILTPLSMGPVFKLWGLNGLWISAILIVWLMISGFKLERLKRINNIRTYSEIIVFLEGKKYTQETINSELKYKNEIGALIGGISAIIVFVLFAISFYLYNK